MKATLTFNLPDEDEEYRSAINAPRVRYGAGEFAEWMRTRLKYEVLTEEQAAELALVREKYFELIGAHIEE